MQQILSLKDIPEAMQQKKYDTQYNIALWIFKYQKFKTRIALEHAPEGYSEQTLQNYFDCGIRFLKTGFKKYNYTSLYSNLKLLIENHTQPLIPSAKDARRVSKRDYTRKDNPPPAAKLEIVNKPLTAKVYYGIKVDGTIKICPSEDYAYGYFNALLDKSTPEEDMPQIVEIELHTINPDALYEKHNMAVI